MTLFIIKIIILVMLFNNSIEFNKIVCTKYLKSNHVENYFITFTF